MGFDSLSGLMESLQRRFPGFSQRLREAKAVAEWEKAVGPIIAKQAKVLRVRQGVLVVVVDHPIWRSELHYRKNEILKILNSAQGSHEEGKKSGREDSEPVLKDIQFLAPSSPGAQPFKSQSGVKSKTSVRPPLPPKEK